MKGVVVNKKTKGIVLGATIWEINTYNATGTDTSGRFILKNISSSPSRIICSVYGFNNDTINVSKSKSNDLVFILSPTVESLEEVQITGIATGSLKAFLDQKKAENIKNIVSQEQIKTFPDLNAAEVMQRIPGITLQRDQGEGRFVQLRGTPPELTNFNVNGEQVPSPEGGVRYVGMDMIASDQIETIEVSKVLTPDMDGDAIAGSVNIKTKRATSTTGELNATLSGGYGAIRQSPNYQGQFSYGQRKGKLGFQLNSSYYRNVQGSDNIEFKYVKGPFFGSQDAGRDNYFVQYREVQLRHYDVTRARIGLSPTLDYKFNNKNSIYLQAMYNRFTDHQVRTRKIYSLDDAVSDSYYLYGGVIHDASERTKIQELTSISLGGEHEVWKLKIDYQLFYALATESVPDRIDVAFENQGQAIAIDFDKLDPNYPRATFPNPSNADNATDYESYKMDQLFFANEQVLDHNFTPRFNIEIPTKFGKNWTGYIKTGAKVRWKEKQRDIYAQDYAAYRQTSNLYPGEGPPLTLGAIGNGFKDDNLLDKKYLLDAMPSTQNIKGFYEANQQFFILDRLGTRTQSFGEDYKASEAIYAGYIMARQDFKKLMILTGVRYELTEINYQGSRIETDGNRFLGMDTIKDSRIHRFLLPQIQLKYAHTKSLNYRAAYTEGYSRPNFDYVLPYRQEEDREEVRFGNPNLRYAKSNNFDFLVEKYLRKGILSGGVFYKNIDDFVFLYKRFAHEGDPANFGLVEITTPINGIRAEVYGAEFQAQFIMDFLPGFWKRFGWYTNYTLTQSEAIINKRQAANYSDAVVVFGESELELESAETGTEKISLPGQAMHTANLALFYDGPRLFIRLTGNYQDAFLTELGADEDLDVYYDQALRFDITMNWKWTNKVTLFCNAVNLTNAPLRTYLGSPDVVKQQEFYSWWMRGGIRINY